MGLHDDLGRPISEFALMNGHRFTGPTPLHYARYEGGAVHDWNWGLGLLPIVRLPVAAKLLANFSSDIQPIALSVAGLTEQLALLNVLTVRDAIDEKRSLAARIKPGEGTPQHVGKFRALGFLTIDAVGAADADIFRLKDAEAAVVVSERVEELGRHCGWSGISFLPTFDGPPTDFHPSQVNHGSHGS